MDLFQADGLKTEKLKVPPLSVFSGQLEGSGERKVSTTMAFVRMLSALCRDKAIGSRIVPIVPDEARTFGMEGLFRQLAIYSSVGQKYVPQDADQVMYYREDKKGQILQEGINEAGSISAWIAAATSAHNNNLTLVPFYSFYSMFGFQRVGDFIWAAGDMQARGFLIGATSGRTTLAGEGLQHLDGHSHILAATVPNCISYDPAFAYELAMIIHNGLERMYQKGEGIFYYLTCMNENYYQPELPHKERKRVIEGTIKGLYKFLTVKGGKQKVRLLSSGSIMQESLKAAELLHKEYSIEVEIWSVPSFNQLVREAQNVARYNNLNPTKKPQQSYLAQCLNNDDSPIVAATDYIRQYTQQLGPYIKAPYYCLGTDGFGRSDSRAHLRDFFEVSSEYIVYHSLLGLYKKGGFSLAQLKKAATKLKIRQDRPYPLYA